jgi:hypothetical protein
MPKGRFLKTMGFLRLLEQASIFRDTAATGSNVQIPFLLECPSLSRLLRAI